MNPVRVQELKGQYYVSSATSRCPYQLDHPKFLTHASQLPMTREYYHGRHLNPRMWLDDSKAVPGQEFLAAAACDLFSHGIAKSRSLLRLPQKSLANLLES